MSDINLKKISNLAKLEFSNDETKELDKKLKNILEGIDEMSQINCSDVKPLKSICDSVTLLRDDIAIDELMTERILDGSPKQTREKAKNTNCFVVPKVIA